jgi:hypothetical protein
MNSPQTNEQSVNLLNSLLRGERAAVETYDQAIEKTKDAPEPALTENRLCHFNRISVISNRITALGGKAQESSGAWGAFAKVAEGSAKVFGFRAAVAALEEGEDRGLADYRTAVGKLDESSRHAVETVLLPAQERTHRRMSDLQKRLANTKDATMQSKSRGY